MNAIHTKVSIIVPCYNQAQYLPEALQSVLDQTYPHWECLIVDDDSPDNTQEVAQEWVNKDSRFLYFKKQNGGVSSSRNLGIEKASGAFIQFLDADDLLAIDKISISIDAVQKHEVAVVCSNYLMFKKSWTETLPHFSQLGDFEFTFYNLARFWNDGFTVPIHCWFFEISLFENNRFPEGLTAQEDWVMWLKIFQKAPKTYYISSALAFYRINLLGRTQTSSFFEETIAAIQFMKPYLSEADFQVLYESVIRRYHNKLLYCHNKEVRLKGSNSYQTGLLLKKIIKIFGILGLARKLFPLILKLKSK